jgi:hypothetical protein
MTTGENAKTLWMWLLHNFPPKKLDAVRVSDNLPLAYFFFVERMFLGLKRVDMYPQSRHKKELMDIADASKKLRLLLSAPSMFNTSDRFKKDLQEISSLIENVISTKHT